MAAGDKATAQTNCEVGGGTLAVIRSPETHAEAKAAIAAAGATNAWLGASFVNSQLVWTEDDDHTWPVPTTNSGPTWGWASSMPDTTSGKECVDFDTSTQIDGQINNMGAWRSRGCTQSKIGLCMGYTCATNIHHATNAFAVGVVDDGGNKYTLAGTQAAHTVGADTYYFSGIPQAHPMRVWQDDGACTVTMTACDNVVSTDYCWGNAAWTIPSACVGQSLSLHCSNHGAMGGTDRLPFNAACSE